MITEKQLFSFLQENFEIKKIDDLRDFEINLKSIELIRLVGLLEKKFGVIVDITPSDIKKLNSFKGILQLINQNSEYNKFSFIKEIHTLGPHGTNCELAAKEWLKINKLHDVFIILHNTLEEALEEVLKKSDVAVLLGCVVYPNLHEIVFKNLGKISIGDVFVKNTYKMVLAKKRETQIVSSVSTHPAPESLIRDVYKVKLANSNSQAALDCVTGVTDACITTESCVVFNDLEIIEDYNEVPMGFTIHGKF